jgi:hypothetical protein
MPNVRGVAAPAAVARAVRRMGAADRKAIDARAVDGATRARACRGSPSPGVRRDPAGDGADREQLVEWMRDFVRETGVEGDPEQIVDRRLLYVWEDGGAVSVVGPAPEVAGVARIGPIYTPAGSSARGYASSAVAAVSKAALAAGVRQCVLYTTDEW